ncbi:MAG TPA: hypothetical protein VKU38_09475 [Ktedonobacteraceae bacterium]|nr:hypothetical protein [Ktedonobacteraceae bacterium]
MQIERYDKRPDLRIEEIQKDWRTWVAGNGYIQIATIPLEYEDARVVLEIWSNPTLIDSHLIYLPRIPHAAGDGGEKLFITDQDHFAFMEEAARKMATMAMILAREKWKARQNQKAMLN